MIFPYAVGQVGFRLWERDNPNESFSLRYPQRTRIAIDRVGRGRTGYAAQGCNKGALSDALGLLRGVSDGGAGIRTPVRDKIRHGVYVRSLLIEVSRRWPVDGPR